MKTKLLKKIRKQYTIDYCPKGTSYLVDANKPVLVLWVTNIFGAKSVVDYRYTKMGDDVFWDCYEELRKSLLETAIRRYRPFRKNVDIKLWHGSKSNKQIGTQAA